MTALNANTSKRKEMNIQLKVLEEKKRKVQENLVSETSVLDNQIAELKKLL